MTTVSNYLTPRNDGTAALAHASYWISDIGASLGFYGALGFVEIARMTHGDDATVVFVGPPGADVLGTNFELLCRSDGTSPERGGAYRHAAVRSVDFDGVLERLAALGCRPLEPPVRVEDGGPRICKIEDPDGYGIELIEARR
jgi:lactoylglutathione lyase